MNTNNDKKQQDEELNKMNYSSEKDIFQKGIELPLDENGNVIKDIQEESESEDLDLGLDVPGAELDDENQEVGSEDEENNYWSLGGDNHDDLEEDNQE